ncbi:zinc finger protein 62-like [Centruroides sculpturatus]|uniref:zinc finger protein 62-like n=1 Tax=Centruroides sculpturatus TaxID=218467 RepID=UPI000C6D6829|nr:zinc finger protein 62-like [Centruroides sculpturatus]
MKIKQELEMKHSDCTTEHNEEKFEVDLKNFKKEFSTDVKCYKTIKSEPLEINIKREPISTHNTNGSSIWSHSGYKIERDIKTEEVEKNYDVKHGIKSECKVVLKKLKIEVKTEDCKEVVYLPDNNEQLMPVNNEFFTPDENFNNNEMNIQIKEEEQIQEYDIPHNSEREKRFKYNIKRNKYVPSSRKCNKIHDKIKMKYFKVMFASHSKQEFTCDLCKKTFTNKRILETHLLCHIRKKPFCCTTCNKKFLWQFLLRRHMKKHKIGNKNEISHRNLRLQPSEDRVKSSLRNDKKSNIQRENVYCDICGKHVPYGKGRLEIHKRTHRTHACEICGKEFKRKGILLRHKPMHSTDRPFKCHICDKSFKSIYQAKDHQKIHSEERPFKCDICNKGYKWKGQLKEHYETHNDERNYSCQVCNKRFKTKNTLTCHKLVHNNQFNHTCDVCNKCFKSKSNLRRHKLVHSKKYIKRENVYCDICGKRVPYGKGSLERHKRIHKVHACEICGKEFKLKKLLLFHKPTHSEERPFKCDICNKGFKWRGLLKRHQKAHSEDRPFKCDICNKGYKFKVQLKLHRETHTDERNYTCQVCNKSFKTKQYLAGHKIVHNDKFNHTCHICNKSFKRRSHLKQHINVHTD